MLFLQLHPVEPPEMCHSARFCTSNSALYPISSPNRMLSMNSSELLNYATNQSGSKMVVPIMATSTGPRCCLWMAHRCIESLCASCCCCRRSSRSPHTHRLLVEARRWTGVERQALTLLSPSKSTSLFGSRSEPRVWTPTLPFAVVFTHILPPLCGDAGFEVKNAM